MFKKEYKVKSKIGDILFRNSWWAKSSLEEVYIDWKLIDKRELKIKPWQFIFLPKDLAETKFEIDYKWSKLLLLWGTAWHTFWAWAEIYLDWKAIWGVKILPYKHMISFVIFTILIIGLWMILPYFWYNIDLFILPFLIIFIFYNFIQNLKFQKAIKLNTENNNY